MARILCPLPDRDFDTTEVAVPWKLLREAGHELVFATETGAKPACDPRLLTGVLFGQLGAAAEPLAFYRELEQAPEFRQPCSWNALTVANYDALLLAGGHAPGMRQYLGSTLIQQKVAEFWQLGRPVGAICHGPLVLARARVAPDGPSVLSGFKTACLPKYMERTAYFLTAWKLGRYYRTYPAYVEEEIRAALASPEDLVLGPGVLSARGTRDDDGPAFAVEDRHYVSARWPGDAYLFAKKLLAKL